MNSISVPKNIAELIVKEVEQTDDGDNYFESMRNLALISKAFVDPIRRRIFHKVVLDDKTDYEHLYSLSASYPHIFPHVQRFYLDAYLYMEDPELDEILSNLINVKEVGISFRRRRSEDREETYPEFHGEVDTDDDDEEDTEEFDAPQNTESGSAEMVPYKVVWVSDVAQDIDSSANDPGDSFSWSQDFTDALQDALGTVFAVPTLEYLYLEGIYDIPQTHIKSILRIPEVSFKNVGFAQDDSDIHNNSQDVITDCARIRYLAIESLSLEAMQPFIDAIPSSTLEALYVTNLGQDHENVDVAQNIIDNQRSLISLTILDERAQLNLNNLPHLQFLHIHMSFFRKPLRDVVSTLQTINPNNHIEEFKVFMEYWCFCLVEAAGDYYHPNEWDVIDDLLSKKLRRGDRIIWAIMPTRDPEILVPEHFSYVRGNLPKTNQTRLLQLVIRDDR